MSRRIGLKPSPGRIRNRLDPTSSRHCARSKQEDGPDLLIQGSGNLIQTLLANELIDEMTVLTFPLLLGKGKRLFEGGAAPGALKLTRSVVSSTGIVVATYERNGAVQTGSFASDQPSEAELERRRTWQ